MARKRTIPVETLVETQQNRKRVLDLRLAGHSQAEICNITGWGKSRVSRYLSSAIADITRESAEEYIELQQQRFDALLVGIWNDATHGDTWKIDRALAIEDQRARLLGLYKTAELKAIADAKGGANVETASMIINLFSAITGAVGTESGEPADDNSEDDEPEEQDGDQ